MCKCEIYPLDSKCGVFYSNESACICVDLALGLPS